MPVAISISPIQDDAQAALKAFLIDILAVPATSVVAANPNRVAEPAAGNFIVMSPIRFERQATNNDATADVKFVGSISQSVLTVNSITSGQIVNGLQILGPGVAPNTTIVRQTSGPPGGTGTYQVTGSQSVAQETLSAGSIQVTATYFMTIQVDFHSTDYTASAWAQTLVTLFRDNYATTFFGALPAPQNAISPLYADDAAMRPFYNAEQQFEWRWVVDVKLQIDQTVTVPQTFADSATVTVVEIP